MSEQPTEQEVTVQRTEGQMVDGSMKVWYIEKGFGFVTCDDGGADLFVHQSAIKVEGDRFRAVATGALVTCEYYLRDGKHTARTCTARGGGLLPGFLSKLEAASAMNAPPAPTVKPGHLTGKVKFMNKDKGFGFITPDVAGQEEVFVHVGDVEGQRILETGEPVSYITTVKKGTRSQAIEVASLRPAPPQPAYPPAPYPQHAYGAPPAGYGAYAAPPAPHYAYDQHYSGYPPQPAYSAPEAQGSGGNLSGTIKWYNEQKGFGFIVPGVPGPDVYFKSADVTSGGPALSEGEAITYATKSSSDGKIWAVSVSRRGPPGGLKRKGASEPELYPKRPAPYPPAPSGYGYPPAPHYGSAPPAPHQSAPPPSHYGAPPSSYPYAYSYGSAPGSGYE